jgi:hypothetical protein
MPRPAAGSGEAGTEGGGTGEERPGPGPRVRRALRLRACEQSPLGRNGNGATEARRTQSHTES